MRSIFYAQFIQILHSNKSRAHSTPQLINITVIYFMYAEPRTSISFEPVSDEATVCFGGT